jgi:hypothetical protein
MLRPFTLASGRWNGVPWKLRAVDSGDGRYGLTVVVDGSRRAHLSGRFYVPGRDGVPIDFGRTWSIVGTRRPFAAGVVTERAKVIRVRLSNGGVRTVRTIAPRCGLSPGISFFVVPLPRGTHPTSFSAWDSAGKGIELSRR